MRKLFLILVSAPMPAGVRRLFVSNGSTNANRGEESIGRPNKNRSRGNGDTDTSPSEDPPDANDLDYPC